MGLITAKMKYNGKTANKNGNTNFEKGSLSMANDAKRRAKILELSPTIDCSEVSLLLRKKIRENW